MRNTIAVMNTKGGVGKSTVLLALAETLAAEHQKTVLVVDADAQASISSMLMTPSELYQLQSSNRTLVDYLVQTVLNQTEDEEWAPYVVRDVSDVDDARSVYLIPSDVQLTLLEREVSREALHGRLRLAIARLLADLRPTFDIVLVDCPPGLSVLTETWLRECDFHMTPTKADYISTCGLEVFRRFKSFDPDMGFAENLGVIINMFDAHNQTDHDYRRWLQETPDNNCFTSVIPRLTALQDASRHLGEERSYLAKYPGDAGRALRALAGELIARIDAAHPAAAEKSAIADTRQATLQEASA
ncbi:MAG: ParA family protein [Pseudomonadota bacterium]